MASLQEQSKNPMTAKEGDNWGIQEGGATMVGSMHYGVKLAVVETQDIESQKGKWTQMCQTRLYTAVVIKVQGCAWGLHQVPWIDTVNVKHLCNQ